ncbi:MAG TPA: hypothetical protein VHR45_13940 [Thermoanaerobaculia bacterium]|nr:hypothetical protein [Thermoanaerobaculia bacterium]
MRSRGRPLHLFTVSRAVAAALAAAAALGAVAAPAQATQVKIFQTQSAVGFLGGKLSGVSVDALGHMKLGPETARLAAIGEPFLLSAAVVPGGWVVGTGNAGKVLAIDGKGAVRELFAAPEPEVFALWADADGTVFAGTSPHGKVYRITGGPQPKGEVFFKPGETYIWALARGADGKLLVATGTQGKLFRVDAKGHGELAFTGDDTHLRSLAVQPGGEVLIGTAGKGLVVRLGRDGHALTLFEAEEPEIVALATAPDGNVYAAAIASEASLVDLARESAAAAPPPGSPPAAAGKPAGRAKPPAAVVQEEPGEGGAVGGRRPGATGPRSEVLRISPEGAVDSLWSFPAETVFSLLWQRGRLWVGTGLEGHLFSYGGSQMELEADVDERQVVALLPGDSGPAFATTNAAALYRITAGIERHGSYTSAALDAGQICRFGSFRWRGELPAGSGLRFTFRSGMSALPDGTWSGWVTPKTPPAGAAGARELQLADLPRGRYVQWRAELTAGEPSAGGGEGGAAASPLISGIELSYRQENLRPKIAAFSALDPGQILVPANFNPANQVFEPAHPSREGIFVPLGAPPLEDGARGVKPLWKKGFRTLRWTASDPNEDALVYDLSFRPEGAAGPWLKIAANLEEDHYSFDATVLPDGVFRFRLVASDRNANDPESALSAERVSEPVVIDNTPPELVSVEHEGKLLRVTLHDAASPIREAVFSVDAAAWKPARAADGLFDSQTETVLIDSAEKPGGLLLLRATDAAWNVMTYDLSRR